MKIKKNSKVYEAIKSAIWEIFDGEIPLEDPDETLDQVIKSINNSLNEGE